MMSNKFKTSLYVSDRNRAISIPITDLRKCVWSSLYEILNEALLPLTFISERQSIISRNIIINFRVRYLFDKILLTFFPFQPKGIIWNKNQCISAIEECLKVCDQFPSIFHVSLPEETLEFKNSISSEEECIDSSDWIVTESYKTPQERKTLIKFLAEGYNFIRNFETNFNFNIFSNQFKDKGYSQIQKLFNILKPYGEIKESGQIELAREFSDKLIHKENEIFIFCDKPDVIKSNYSKNKIYFDSRCIPTQFLRIGTINKLIQFPGVRANFILELMTKIGLEPLILRPNPGILDTAGTLCLSDISGDRNNIFGALFTYSKEGYTGEEEVQLYSEIDFTVEKNQEYIDFTENALELLTKKISLLTGKKLNFDILLTKRWSYRNIEKFIDLIDQENLRVNKIYYISSKTSRFVDSYILETKSKTKNPYMLINEKVAFLRTATDIRIYPTISNLFIELIWPNDYKIEVNDLEKILWLTKKRIYRIQEFGVLKQPEPMVIFNNLSKVYLSDIKGTLSIPLRLLI